MRSHNADSPVSFYQCQKPVPSFRISGNKLTFRFRLSSNIFYPFLSWSPTSVVFLVPFATAWQDQCYSLACHSCDPSLWGCSIPSWGQLWQHPPPASLARPSWSCQPCRWPGPWPSQGLSCHWYWSCPGPRHRRQDLPAGYPFWSPLYFLLPGLNIFPRNCKPIPLLPVQSGNVEIRVKISPNWVHYAGFIRHFEENSRTKNNLNKSKFLKTFLKIS